MKEHAERIRRIQELCSRLDAAIKEARMIRETVLRLQFRRVKAGGQFMGGRRAR